MPRAVAAADDLRAARPVGGGGSFDWPRLVVALAAACALAVGAAGLAGRGRLPEPNSSPG